MPLITTLQQRDKPVTKEDFRDCPSLQVNCDISELLNLWNLSIHFTPFELSKIFERAFDRGFFLEFQWGENKNQIEFQLCRDDRNFQKNIYDFTIPRNPQLDLSLVRFDPKARGQNWGHRFDALFAELNVALGVRQYSFIATHENGAYIWPFKGYSMNMEPSDRSSKVERVSSRVSSRLKVLENLIPPDVYQEALKWAQFKEKRDVCHLAKMDFNLGDHLNERDFDLYDGYIYDSLKQSFLSENKPLSDRLSDFDTARRYIVEAMVFCRDRERVFTLGKFALAGERLECVCDYDDDQQVQEIFGDRSIFHHTKPALPQFIRKNHLQAPLSL